MADSEAHALMQDLTPLDTIVLQGVGATLQVGQTVTADFDFG